MMNMEDRLWDYIDGLSSKEERNAIEQLMKTDAAVSMKHEELLSFHQQLQSIELDEPSMGFKNRVMEQVLASPQPSALKTKVDKRIISVIAGFFIVTIGGMLAYTISQMNWTGGESFTLPKMELPAINWSLFGSPAFTLFFLSVNVVLGLVLLDKIITARRKHSAS